MSTQALLQRPDPNALFELEPLFVNSPQTVARVSSEANREVPDLRRLCQWIGTDPALAARLLQMANADRYRLCGQVATISEALAVLDPAQLRSMVQSATVSGAFRPVPGLEMRRFWSYSLNTAKVARSLAGTLHLNAGIAYTAGLVHALGELAILGSANPRVPRVAKSALPLGLLRAKAERRRLGYCHADVIASFARRWQWPTILVDILAHQHAPFETDDCEPLAGVLHLAAWRAAAREAGLSGNALTVTFPDPVGVLLGLDIDAVLQQDPIDWHSRLAS